MRRHLFSPHAEILSEGRPAGPEQGRVSDWEGHKMTVGKRKRRSFCHIIHR